MPRARRLAQNVVANWVALAVTTLVGFSCLRSLSIILGNLYYGVWVIIMWLRLRRTLDLGLRGGLSLALFPKAPREAIVESSW